MMMMMQQRQSLLNKGANNISIPMRQTERELLNYNLTPTSVYVAELKVFGTLVDETCSETSLNALPDQLKSFHLICGLVAECVWAFLIKCHFPVATLLQCLRV